MTQTTRHHHINPRFILAGFTESGKKTDRLWSFDSELSKSTRLPPKAVAWELDFYAVDAPGEPPDVVEKAFGAIEGIAAPIIREIIRTESLPSSSSGSDLGDFLTFLALMYVRDRGWRETIASVPEQVMELRLKLALSSRGRWEATRADMAKRGYEGGTYEEMLEIVDSAGFGIKIANPGPLHVQQIAFGLQLLPPLFSRRNWSLLMAQPGAGDFVSSDNPAFIAWTVPGLSHLSSPGLGYLDTEVTFALHRRIAIVGSLEDRPEKVSATKELVADINGRTARHAVRFVYGPANDFVWSDQTGRILSAADWFAWRAALKPGK
jgi:hypothetical protein